MLRNQKTIADTLEREQDSVSQTLVLEVELPDGGTAKINAENDMPVGVILKKAAEVSGDSISEVELRLSGTHGVLKPNLPLFKAIVAVDPQHEAAGVLSLQLVKKGCIKVESPEGRVVEVDSVPEMTLRQVKEEALIKAGEVEPENHFSLLFNGEDFEQTLEDTVESSGTRAGSTLQLSRKPSVYIKESEGGKVHSFIHAITDPLSALKDKIEKMDGSLADVDLVLDGRTMSLNLSLLDNNIPFGATIELRRQKNLQLRCPANHEGVHSSSDSGEIVQLKTSNSENASSVFHHAAKNCKQHSGPPLNSDHYSLIDSATGTELKLNVPLRDQGIGSHSTLALSPKFDIFVHSMDAGKSHRFIVNREDSVGAWKNKIATQFEVDPDAFVLAHNNTVLTDEQSFSAQDVRSHTILTLQRRRSVSVLLLNGKVFSVPVGLNDTVASVEKYLEEAAAIPPLGQLLMHKGTELANVNRTLLSYDVRIGDQLELQRRPALTVVHPDGTNVPVDVHLPTATTDTVFESLEKVLWKPFKSRFKLFMNNTGIEKELCSDIPLEAQNVAYGSTLALIPLPALIVEFPDGREFKLKDEEVKATNTVEDLKLKLAEVVDSKDESVAKIVNLEAFLGGRKLVENMPLTDQGVSYGDTLVMGSRSDCVDVQLPNGDDIVVNLTNSTLVSDVITKVKYVLPTGGAEHPMEIRLLFKGDELKRTHTLRRAGVKPGDRLTTEPIVSYFYTIIDGHCRFNSSQCELVKAQVPYDATVTELQREVGLRRKVIPELVTIFYEGWPLSPGKIHHNGVRLGSLMEAIINPIIYARFLGGKVEPVFGAPWDTFDVLLGRAAQRGMFAADHFRFLNNGEVLNLQSTFEQSGIDIGSVLHLIARPIFEVQVQSNTSVPVFQSYDTATVESVVNELSSTGSIPAGSVLADGKRVERYGLTYYGVHLDNATSLAAQNVQRWSNLVLDPAVPTEYSDIIPTKISSPSMARIRRGEARMRGFGSHLKPGCDLANYGPKECAVDYSSYLMLTSYEQRRNLVNCVLVLILLTLGLTFQYVIHLILRLVQKAENNLLRQLLETLFRQLAVVLLMVMSITIFLNFDFIEYGLDFKLFGDVMELFPAMARLFGYSHLEMLFDEMLNLIMFVTATYFGFVLILMFSLWSLNSWIRSVDGAPVTEVLKLHAKKKRFTSMHDELFYIYQRSEFLESVISLSLPGLDPKYCYFGEYCRAGAYTLLDGFIKLRGGMLISAMILCTALLPVSHWRRTKEVLVVLAVASSLLLGSLLVLLRLYFIRRRLEPRNLRAAVESREVPSAEITLDAATEPRYNIGPVAKSYCCWRAWTKFFCGTLVPTRHQSVFWFWKNGPSVLLRVIGTLYFLQVVVTANVFYLLDTHTLTWWYSNTFVLAILIFVLIGVQCILLRSFLWNLLLVSYTGGMIDEVLLQSVWEYERAAAVKRSCQLVDHVRAFISFSEVERGVPLDLQSLREVATNLGDEVKVQNEIIFSKLDHDKDGLLSLQNFHGWLTSQGINLDEKGTHIWIEILDREKRGGLDFTDFSVAVMMVKKLLSEHVNPEAVKAFLVENVGLSNNGSQVINLKILKEIVATLRLPWNDWQIKHFYDFLKSRAEDGIVTMDAFVKRLPQLESSFATLQQAVGDLRRDNREDV